MNFMNLSTIVYFRQVRNVMTNVNSEWAMQGRARRKQMRKSLNDVARLAGVSDQTVRNAELGLKQPTDETVTAINEALSQLEQIAVAVANIGPTPTFDLATLLARVEALEILAAEHSEQLLRMAPHKPRRARQAIG